MGFTPLDGLVMATRAGAVDPGLFLWLLTDAGLDLVTLEEGLQRHSGLVGLSGVGGDMRAVLAAREAGDPDASLAFDVYIHRLRREVAAMTAALGGLDVLAFTGGVGERAAPVRAACVEGLAYLGVGLDVAANDAATSDADISAAGTDARVVVITSREDLEMAAEARRALH
jgi:acetate kinase